jgi:hypothetical protein
MHINNADMVKTGRQKSDFNKYKRLKENFNDFTQKIRRNRENYFHEGLKEDSRHIDTEEMSNMY